MPKLSSPLGPITRTFSDIIHAFVAAVARLDKSLNPAVTLNRLRAHNFTRWDSLYIFHFANATFWITLMQDPAYPKKLAIPILYAIALLIPFTSQFFVPATPVFSWILSWYSSRFMPSAWRPSISVSLLPTLESVLYGANISDILTRFTHPILDILAWLPYGVVHFTCPFVVAIFLWLFRSKQTLHLWARTFGYMNLVGVLIQIVLPCSPPWYELIHGLTPANYGMKGSPGGLARIDALFHSSSYTTGFTNSPLVFGAFPSLHAGNATLEAFFLSHFFPQVRNYIWAYATVLYWATMYLTHHYLIDVVGGACLATAFFYLFLPDELRGPAALAPPPNLNLASHSRNKYNQYDLEDPRAAPLNGYGRGGVMLSAREFDAISEPSSEEEEDITYRSPVPGATSFPAGVHDSAAPMLASAPPGKKGPAASTRGRGHRHTASIASLIRGEERGPEDGWSPVAGSFPGGNGRGRVD
ncbi:Inositol phosphorylceramide synthase catalytic subunit aur1 [Psilocybe cubensis]|uniref:Phosphatidic acid phosphatase type 2/haloperoxidase domain-containing protein n=2 Tax=Psilocybe cubensis TaxID=181762 RepID=A0A8H7XP98_PSICU|nr:Inositol phosphorylceramide synthase catalytic subunit aur1 [Psilocybe cubensis]KAH9475186.1 Inositol phosphorylceramide synthase catalytic subunit aur1 [Psilocybe cubensis]